MDTASLIAWISDHPLETVATGLYVVANVAPRPHPEQLTGWKKWIWTVVDRLAFLTSSAIPGRLKLPFLASPSPPPAAETKTDTETKDQGERR